MIKLTSAFNTYFIILISFLILFNVLIPVGSTIPEDIRIEGYTQGVSYTSVVPLKKAMFVDYDDNNYLDDYAYLASIPATVFNDKNQLVSNPLLFYQDSIKFKDQKKKILNAKLGIDYFMEDWLSFCGGKLDQIVGVNVESEKLREWSASEYITIKGNTSFELASDIALHDWSYSDNAVLAVIEEQFEKPNYIFSNTSKCTFPIASISDIPTFELQQTNSLNPIYHDFTISNNYKYIKAEVWWDGIFFGDAVIIPTGDPDIQLYCQEKGEWMQSAAIANWNIYSPKGHEYTFSHVYNPGSWRIGITDFPTEGEAPRKSRLGGLVVVQGSLLKALASKVTYHVDVTLYPGIDIPLSDIPPFGCRDATFKLMWDNPNVCLGFSLIGPSGEVIFTSINESRTKMQEMHIHQLGECKPGENYSISVFTLDEVRESIDFEIEYEWKQKFSKSEGNSLTSATEGAILASTMNSPLLYITQDTFPKITEQALLQLGTKNIFLVDVGKELSSQVINDIKNSFKISVHFSDLSQIYNYLRSLKKMNNDDLANDNNDIIFATIDPWTYWYMGELQPGGETQAALFLGPAAYLAAHHCCPVVIIDMHPELSSAAVWHTEFWRNYVAERYEHIPSVADMVLTGRRVYTFLNDFGFDKEGRETIITVAGQYDIGIPWDRVFVGEAKTGRIWGTPIDAAYWISRSVFYPALIFENPAVGSDHTVELINGSVSVRSGIRGLFRNPLFNTLVIQRESEKEKFEYPVLCSFVTHKYRFNERASKYYGSKYQCADGLIPGEDTTMNPIDQGVNKKYYNQDGSYFPDMTESEVIPFYLNKGGFDAVFSTQLETVMDNLNQGVILWIHASHGLQHECGSTLFWDPDEGFKNNRLLKILAGATKEKNPWRGYDWLLGSTQEPDTMSMDFKGVLPFTNINGLLFPATGMDYVLARKPIREKINSLLDIIKIIPFRFNSENLYDGLTGTIAFSKYPLADKNASDMEHHMGNLHSVGFITSICQTSNTYLHLMMLRHGSVFQVQDPWPTSWYGAIWRQSIPRDIILGDTVGEAYVKGMKHTGILYIGDNGGPPQWWWDSAENVVYFGDPNLRMYVPTTEYSNANTWEKPQSLMYDANLNINGHMPYGTTSHPNKIHQITFLDRIIWLSLVLILLIITLVVIIGKRKRNDKKKK
jgi:hypothetical protein